MIDEYTRKCLATRVGSSLKAHHVLDTLSTLFITEGVPGYIRSDNGTEFTARTLRQWIRALASGARGRGFESPIARNIYSMITYT